MKTSITVSHNIAISTYSFHAHFTDEGSLSTEMPKSCPRPHSLEVLEVVIGLYCTVLQIPSVSVSRTAA